MKKSELKGCGHFLKENKSTSDGLAEHRSPHIGVGTDNLQNCRRINQNLLNFGIYTTTLFKIKSKLLKQSSYSEKN